MPDEWDALLGGETVTVATVKPQPKDEWDSLLGVGTTVAAPTKEPDAWDKLLGGGLEPLRQYGQQQDPQIAAHIQAQPHWARNATEAAAETIQGFVPRTAGQAWSMFFPPAQATHDIHRTYQAVRDWIGGQPVTDVVKNHFPESQEIPEADKTPPWSKERFKVGFGILGKFGMAAAGVAGLRSAVHPEASIEAAVGASNVIRSQLESPKLIEQPKVNPDTGGGTPPTDESIYAPDTPPGADPDLHYAMRSVNLVKRWWENLWPRDLAVSKTVPDSPVISEHQRLIESDMRYMQDFTKSDWWKAVRARPEEELIDIEDTAVKNYRARLLTGNEPKKAYEDVISKLPRDVQALMRHRESRIPIEQAASVDLGVDPPQYTGDPYIARLTNEEGKNIVDVHPRLGNIGKQIRTTIGSFDNSRVHVSMKDGIKAGTQYEPIKRSVFLRELTSARLEATANMLRRLRGEVLFESPKEALAASPTGKIAQVRGFGGRDYWARTREEAIFLEHNLKPGGLNPLSRLQQVVNTYVRNPSLVNPLPHTTKNMFFKYMLARVGNFKFKFDTKEFASATPNKLRQRFDIVMPMTETGTRMPELQAREIGNWAEKLTSRGLMINRPSTKFIFAKADPAMRYSLWKSYIRKGMSDQEAANHVWLDLIRYDANSGGISFWKNIPFNFFVPWRVGAYTAVAKQFMAHPIRTLLFVGAVDYLREIAYRNTGWWVHLPTDYVDAPIAEAIQNPKGLGAVAATTLIFGPGGSQTPSTIKQAMDALNNDPGQKARVMNMFWGLSQLYNIPREYEAFQKDGDQSHLVKILANAAFSAHAALKYEPRRLTKWLPEWMPFMEKAQLVDQAESLQKLIEDKRQKAKSTYEVRHSISRTLEFTPEEEQMQELQRSSGKGKPKKPRPAFE